MSPYRVSHGERLTCVPAVDVVGFMATVSGMSETNDSGLSVAREALDLPLNTDGGADDMIDAIAHEAACLDDDYDREEQRAGLLRLIRWAIVAVEKIDAEEGA